MPSLLHQLWKLVNTRLPGWRLPLVIAIVVFATSWLGMWLAEPVDNEITRPANYWWWFLVTAATVGYGDFFPKTTLGVVGAYVIIGGIVTLTILFTRLASYLQAVRGTPDARTTGGQVRPWGLDDGRHDDPCLRGAGCCCDHRRPRRQRDAGDRLGCRPRQSGGPHGGGAA
ncbi:MAG TPA: potassium channel family protein [Pseudonocardiaceae bacterium]|nr:potassium channel family protein [Pseudonocardiaceae bacterium]